MPRRYRIYLLSAKTILSYAKEEGGAVSIALNRTPPGGAWCPAVRSRRRTPCSSRFSAPSTGTGSLPRKNRA